MIQSTVGECVRLNLVQKSLDHLGYMNSEYGIQNYSSRFKQLKSQLVLTASISHIKLVVNHIDKNSINKVKKEME